MGGWFHRTAGFAGKDEQGFRRVDAGACGTDPIGVGGVQYDKFRPAVLLTEYGAEHFGREGGSAHTHNDTMFEILFYIFGKGGYAVNAFQRPVIDFLPTQKFDDKVHTFFILFPKSGVLGPEFGIKL